MPRYRPAHILLLVRRAERRADLLSLLDLYQSIDDVAARHQQAMDLLVNGVDLLAQHLERGRSGGRLRHLRILRGIRAVGMQWHGLGKTIAKCKANLDVRWAGTMVAAGS